MRVAVAAPSPATSDATPLDEHAPWYMTAAAFSYCASSDCGPPCDVGAYEA
jgi:hypothetical protein